MQAAQHSVRRSQQPQPKRNSILSPIRCKNPDAEEGHVEESKDQRVLDKSSDRAKTAGQEDTQMSVEEETHSCLLMTSQDRYYRYEWSIETESDDSKKLVFTKGTGGHVPRNQPAGEAASHKPIEYRLRGLQVCSIDTENEKNVCSQKRHFALNFI